MDLDTKIVDVLNANQVALSSQPEGKYWTPKEQDESKKLHGCWTEILNRMVTPKMISVQPSTSWIMKQFYYKYRLDKVADTSGDSNSIGMMECTIDLKSIDAEMETRRFKANSVEEVPGIALELDREILSSVHDATKQNKQILESTDIKKDLWRGVQSVWRKGMRGPANWMISSPKLLIESGIVDDYKSEDDEIKNHPDYVDTRSHKVVKVYSDSLFPEGELLLGYNGTSIFDTNCIWSPYRLESQEWSPGVYRPKIRHKITVTGNDFYSIIKLVK